MAQPLLFKLVEVAKPLRPHERSVDVLEFELNNVANCEDITCSADKVTGEPKKKLGRYPGRPCQTVVATCGGKARSQRSL
eukprot:6106083-Amphidinium_carterae.1